MDPCQPRPCIHPNMPLTAGRFEPLERQLHQCVVAVPKLQNILYLVDILMCNKLELGHDDNHLP